MNRNHSHLSLGQSSLDVINPQEAQDQVHDCHKFQSINMNFIISVTVRTLVTYSIILSDAKWTRLYLFAWTVVRFVHGDKSLLDEPDLGVMFFSYFS